MQLNLKFVLFLSINKSCGLLLVKPFPPRFWPCCRPFPASRGPRVEPSSRGDPGPDTPGVSCQGGRAPARAPFPFSRLVQSFGGRPRGSGLGLSVGTHGPCEGSGAGGAGPWLRRALPGGLPRPRCPLGLSRRHGAGRGSRTGGCGGSPALGGGSGAPPGLEPGLKPRPRPPPSPWQPPTSPSPRQPSPAPLRRLGNRRPRPLVAGCSAQCACAPRSC